MLFQRAVGIISPFRGLLSTKSSIPLAQTISSKTVEERIGLPPKPKRPLTPYFRYMKEVRAKVVAANNNLPASEIAKTIAKQWEGVDESKKKKYEEEYKKEQLSYVQRRTQYENKLTDEQKDNIRLMKETLAEKKEKRAYRKRVKELGRPKHPQSPFLIFLNEERKKNPQGSMPYREWMTKSSSKWLSMSDDFKEPFIQKSQKEMQKYKDELNKWESRMIQLGNLDVVRQKVLLESSPSSPRKRTAKP
ncbi:transcription factor A, mitochondrial [Sergentomyia squamirostris]